ncbi:MAG: phosphocholine cytidylyltransferase family protein [Calditrichaeota bacterium]|nr:MAG: phosphocholine cytidylyltransferase family protein [Calditrichota bacterium]
MKTIILAAGEGTRLRPYTLDCPKCLVELGGKPLLIHQVEILKKSGIQDITIVTGYCANKIKALGYKTCHNPNYQVTNMVATLMCANELLDGNEDVLIAYGDILYEPRIVQELLNCNDPLCTSVDLNWLRLWKLRMQDPLIGAETMKFDAAGYIIELGRKPQSYEEIQGQYMGLIKVNADMAPRLVEVYEKLNSHCLYGGHTKQNMYMTSFLQYLIDHGYPVRAVLVKGGWLEVDTVNDLYLYRTLYSEGKLNELCNIFS